MEIRNHMLKNSSYRYYGLETNPLDEAVRIYRQRRLNCSDRGMSDDNAIFMKIFHDVIERRKGYYL